MVYLCEGYWIDTVDSSKNEVSSQRSLFSRSVDHKISSWHLMGSSRFSMPWNKPSLGILTPPRTNLAVVQLYTLHNH